MNSEVVSEPVKVEPEQVVPEPVKIEDIALECPHCSGVILVIQFNCRIFRHGIFKGNGEQIPPHLSQEECEALVRDDLIWGCGKPFLAISDAQGWRSEVCGYI